jgi:hypothetical protein
MLGRQYDRRQQPFMGSKQRIRHTPCAEHCCDKPGDSGTQRVPDTLQGVNVCLPPNIFCTSLRWPSPPNLDESQPQQSAHEQHGERARLGHFKVVRGTDGARRAIN